MHRILTSFLLALSAACLPSAPGHAAEIGRLFLSVPERAELDRLRRGGAPAAPRPAPSPRVPLPETETEGDARALPATLSLDGVVARSGRGRATTWIDAVPHLDGERGRPQAVILAGGRAVALNLPSGKRVVLKPGQQVDLASGRISESYAVRPPPVAPPATAQ